MATAVSSQTPIIDSPPERWVGVRFWKDALGISNKTVRKWIKEKFLPAPVTFGNTLRWRRAAAEAFLAEREREAADA